MIARYAPDGPLRESSLKDLSLSYIGKEVPACEAENLEMIGLPSDSLYSPKKI